MDVTSIANIATHMSQAKVLNEVGFAVMDMAMDNMKLEGNEIAELVESAPSIEPNLGASIDVSV